MKCTRCNFEISIGMYCPVCGWNQKITPDKCLLSQIYENWSTRHYSKVGFKTKEGYEAAWKKIQIHKDKCIQDITFDEWQDIFDNMEGYSLSAQKKVQILISQLYKYAEVRGIVQTNVSKGLLLSGKEKCETLPFKMFHIEELTKCAKDKTNKHWLTARITLIFIFTGFRPNELFSLKRTDVNLKRNYLIGGSKTAAGKNRIIPIVPQIRPYIIELYLQTSFANNDYLLKGVKGAKYNLRNWRTRSFYPMTYDLGFNSFEDLKDKKKKPHYTPYSGRHTFATLSNKIGMDKEAIIKIMGHTDFSTTSKYYVHNDLEFLKEEMQKLENLTDFSL